MDGAAHGAAEARGGDYFGPPVNRVARLLAAGHGGQILLSQAAWHAVRAAPPAQTEVQDLGPHRLKDLQQPEHVFQFLHPDLRADFPPLRSLEAFAHNLPRQLTSFIGREREMAEIRQLLSTASLLTLTGAGGTGKTRLALQVAADLLEEYSDGVWLVELAPLSDPTLVPQAVASVLGLREEPGKPLTQTLVAALKSKRLLLLLDNCEHLLAACPALAETLLHGCSGARILATSRESLNIPGEVPYQEALALSRELKDRRGMAWCLECLEEVAAAEHQPRRAARLMGAAETLLDAIGASWPPNYVSGRERSRAGICTAIGAEAFATAWAEGRAMTPEQAVAYALEERQARGGSDDD